MEIFIATVFAILIFVCFRRLSSLQQQLENSQKEVRLLQKYFDTLRNEVRAGRVQSAMAHESAAPEISTIPPAIDFSMSEKPTVAPTNATPVVKPLSRPVVTPLPPKKPERSKQEWEALVGGKVLNRIGALALVIGVGFFFKYAVDQNWISPALRVVMGIAAGCALLAGGERFHRKSLRLFAQGLTGAGIGVLYLSCFATFNFYHLVGQPVAFAMMSVVTVITFIFAFRYDSLAISIMGWAGGFVTPFLLSTGEVNTPGLFTYIVLLDIGLLAALVKKESWYVLEPLTFVATYFVYVLWCADQYLDTDPVVPALFLTVVWLLFHAMEIIHLRRAHKTHLNVRAVIFLANAGCLYLAMYFKVYPDHPEGMASISLGFGAAYMLSYFLLRKSTVAFGEKDQARFTMSAMAMLVIATAIQYRHDPFIVVAAWSFDAVLIAWFGIRQGIVRVWQSALLVFVMAIGKFVLTPDAFFFISSADYTLIFTWRTMSMAVMAIFMGGSILDFKELDHPSRAKIITGLRYAWPAVVFALITVETNDWYSANSALFNTTAQELLYRDMLTLALAWMGYSLAMIGAGAWKKNASMIDCGVVAGMLAVVLECNVGFSYVPIEQYAFLLNLRAGSLALIALAALLNTRMIKHAGNVSTRVIISRNLMFTATGVVIFVLITGETVDYFNMQINAAGYVVPPDGALMAHLENMQQLMLSGAWLVYSIALMVYGFVRRVSPVRIAAIILFGVTILKIFLYDLSFLETLYRIFSFIGLGVILLVASYLYTKYKTYIFGEGVSKN